MILHLFLLLKDTILVTSFRKIETLLLHLVSQKFSIRKPPPILGFGVTPMTRSQLEIFPIIFFKNTNQFFSHALSANLLSKINTPAPNVLCWFYHHPTFLNVFYSLRFWPYQNTVDNHSSGIFKSALIVPFIWVNYNSDLLRKVHCPASRLWGF
jgi:hypothetical protein